MALDSRMRQVHRVETRAGRLASPSASSSVRDERTLAAPPRPRRPFCPTLGRTVPVGPETKGKERAVTLHLTYVNKNFVLTVGDRLLTRNPAPGVVEEFDPLANKTVIVLGLNCHLAIAYTGLAHIDGKPTADWIAEQISGMPATPPLSPGHGHPISYYSLDKGRPLHLRNILDSLRHGMKRDLPRQRVDRKHLEIAVSGWTFQRRMRFEPGAAQRSRPIYVELVHSGKAASETRVTAERIERLAPGFVLGVIGVKVPKNHIEAMLAEHRSTVDSGAATDRTLEALLVRTIREVAQSQASVGTDCMAVRLSRRPPDVRVRFNRDPSRVTAAFTPYVIAPGVSVPPQYSWIGPPVTLNGVNYEVDPPFPPSPIFNSSSQPQKLWP